MAGDVNLYFNDAEDERVAEIEVMIAEERSRRKGLATEALLTLMAYAVDRLSVRRFVAIISERNAASLRLFGALGFVQHSHSRVFREITFHREVDSPLRCRLSAVLQAATLQPGGPAIL
jgi:tubulin N-terminal N-acetyltransferase